MLFKNGSTQVDIAKKLKTWTKYTIKTTCEDTLSLLGLTGSESLMGHECIGTLVKSQKIDKDGNIDYKISCIGHDDPLFGN